MQRFATITNLNIASVMALGVLLAPLVANGTTTQTSAPVVNPRTVAVPVIVLPVGDDPDRASERPDTPESISTDEWAYQYLISTAHPGGTMTRQGPEVAIRRLHPQFATRLAGAIREARERGLTEAGIFSAYRPPAFGVGGYRDKFHSLHSYGLAVDMDGIGGPGSSQAKLWHSVAANHGVACPYGADNAAEWNHCQPTRVKIILTDNPLRKTISANGPQDPFDMFEAGNALIESVANVFASFDGRPPSNQEDRNEAQPLGFGELAKANRAADRQATRLGKREDRAGTGSAASSLLANEVDHAIARASQIARRIRIADVPSSKRNRHLGPTTAHKDSVKNKGHLKNKDQVKNIDHVKKSIRTAAVKRTTKHRPA